jgi:hypothetical protein
MNRKIHHTGPSVGHHAAVGASSRLNAAAAFRALLNLMRSQAGPLMDKRVRRGSSTAGGALGRGGSHAGVETDEAVDASTSNEGGGDKNGQRRESEGGGGSSEGAIPASSFFFTMTTARDAGHSSPTSQPISNSSQPVVWPAAVLPGAWRRADHPASAYVPSSYVPSSDLVDRTSAPAPRFYTPWNPSVGGDAVLGAAKRGGRTASVVPYALPPAPIAPRVRTNQYRRFTPARRPAAGAVSTVSRQFRPGGWVRATNVRPFVSSVLVAKAPIQRIRYRRFTRPSLTPDTLKPEHGSRVAKIRPYRSPDIFVPPQIKRSKMQSYMPPPQVDGVNDPPLHQRVAGERLRPMSIDALLSSLRDSSSSTSVRGWDLIGVGKRPSC